MIRYALLCRKDHEFDGWFRSSAVFEEQARAGEVACPVCGNREVRKALMAPSLARNESGAGTPAETIRTMMTALRRHVEENCDYVGDAFAETARRIHYGEEEQRGIYGEATPDEARDLVEEGVEVTPLPVLPPRQTN